jgi:ribosomal protein S18 acetylase RimI-like enzyme
MILRRLRATEAASLRELRLRALEADPGAFAEPPAAARSSPPGRWAEWVAAGAAGDTQVVVIAEDGDRWVGMVACQLLERPAGSAWLTALWVDPDARRAGLGSRLIEAVADWARERGATTLDLSVTTNNEPAAALYVHAGFAETGRSRPLPSDPSRTEVFLSRRL